MEKCYICGKEILSKEPIWRRDIDTFAHYKCQEEVDKNALYEFVKELFHLSSVSYRIEQQIKNLHDVQGFPYSGIQKSLEYFYVIKGNPIEKANGGCGIVPFVYNEAYRYFYEVYARNERNKEVELNTKDVEVTISKPKGNEMRKKKFAFLGE